MRFEERLREIEIELLRQDEEWERLRSALEALGDGEVLVSRELLEKLTSPPETTNMLPQGSFIRV